MQDLGDPGSYLTLSDGTPVYSSDGDHVARVTHVLADADDDIFDGFVTDGPLGHRFVDADQVQEIFERGVVLRLNAEEVAALPAPAANPAAIEVGADDLVKDELKDKLHRAWRLISGG